MGGFLIIVSVIIGPKAYSQLIKAPIVVWCLDSGLRAQATAAFRTSVSGAIGFFRLRVCRVVMPQVPSLNLFVGFTSVK